MKNTELENSSYLYKKKWNLMFRSKMILQIAHTKNIIFKRNNTEIIIKHKRVRELVIF